MDALTIVAAVLIIVGIVIAIIDNGWRNPTYLTVLAVSILFVFRGLVH